MTSGMAQRPLRVAGWIVAKLFYAVWVALMIATPAMMTRAFMRLLLY